MGLGCLGTLYYNQNIASKACNRLLRNDPNFFLKYPELVTEPTLIFDKPELQPVMVSYDEYE